MRAFQSGIPHLSVGLLSTPIRSQELPLLGSSPERTGGDAREN